MSFTLSRAKHCRSYWGSLCFAGVFLLAGMPTGSAKLGETLPQLVKRFGNEYTKEGSEKDGSLKYKFRSKIYSVDAVMTQRGNNLVSCVEYYYSDKPLQTNGEPPVSIVRGIMNITAPGAKWREVPLLGKEEASFITLDGTYVAAVLPPDRSVSEQATFTVIVGKIKGEGSSIAEQRSLAASESTDSPPVVPSRVQDSQPPAADSLAITLPTGKIVHFQTPEEKADYESAMGLNTAPAGLAAASPVSQPLMVVGRTTQNGWEMLRLSNGTFALPAKLEIVAYGNNEIAADQTFKGQRIPIFGIIDSFGTDLFGYPYVVIDRESGNIIAVQCTFDKSAASTLATLQKGQVLALVGKHNGKLFNIQVSDCTLIPWQKFDDKLPVAPHATLTPRKHS